MKTPDECAGALQAFTLSKEVASINANVNLCTYLMDHGVYSWDPMNVNIIQVSFV